MIYIYKSIIRVNCLCCLHPLPPARHYTIMAAIFAYATPLHLKISLRDDAFYNENEHFFTIEFNQGAIDLKCSVI